MVGIVLEAALLTSEESLGPPVTFAGIAATGASLAGVFGLNKDHRDTPLPSLVEKKILELFERPAVEVGILRFPVLCALPDTPEVLKDEEISLAKAIYNAAANQVVQSAHPAALPARKPFEEPFSTFGSSARFGLESSPKLPEMFSSPENRLPLKLKPVGASSKVVNAKVNPYRISNFLLGRVFHLHRYVEIKIPTFLHQGSKGGFLTRKKVGLLFTQHKRNFNPSTNHTYRGSKLTFLLYQPEKPGIKVKRAVVKLYKLYPSIFRFVGLSHPVSGTNSKVGLQTELLSCFPVNEVVESNGIENPSFKSNAANPVTGFLEHLEKGIKRSFIPAVKLELRHNRLSHGRTSIAYMPEQVEKERGWCRIPLSHKCDSLLRRLL